VLVCKASAPGFLWTNVLLEALTLLKSAVAPQSLLLSLQPVFLTSVEPDLVVSRHYCLAGQKSTLGSKHVLDNLYQLISLLWVMPHVWNPPAC
jgi:hypothetical protein